MRGHPDLGCDNWYRYTARQRNFYGLEASFSGTVSSLRCDVCLKAVEIAGSSHRCTS
ncbi:MAG: hypothetical protein SP1CHLAM42_03040 [Chlamydiales bacterium]|nr:hypothetical protein [Chlamydiales bacterium]